MTCRRRVRRLRHGQRMSLIAALVDLVLPRGCVGCDGPAGPICARCLPSPPALPAGGAVWAAAAYDGALRTALLAYKERGRRDLAAPLGALLGRAARAALAERGPPAAGGVVLVPVPSARAAAAARGGDHVLRLARYAAADCGVRLVRGALTLTRAVRDSAGLNPAERGSNMAGAIAARPAPAGLAAIIVDDIVTTGSTLREARRALLSAGWPVLGAAVVAATQRRAPLPLAEHIHTV